MFEEKVGTAYVDLETRGDLNRQLQQQRQELERVEAQAKRTQEALSHAKEQGASGLAGLQRQVAEARAKVAYNATPEGKAERAEMQRLQGELGKLNRQLGKGGEETGGFAAGLRAAAIPLASLTAAFYFAERAAHTWMESLSPTTAKTLDDSWQNLYATLGDLVTPAFEQFAGSLQGLTRWVDRITRESNKPADQAGFFGNAWASVREGLEDFVAHPERSGAPGGAIAQAAARRTMQSGALGESAQGLGNAWAQLRNLMSPDHSVVPPAGGPVARYQTGEDFSQALNVAGLSVGTNDPATERLEKQLRWLEQHNEKLAGIEKNTEAMNRYLESLRAWR